MFCVPVLCCELSVWCSGFCFSGFGRALVVYLLRRGIFCTETVRRLLYLRWKTKNRRQQNEMSETLFSFSDDVGKSEPPWPMVACSIISPKNLYSFIIFFFFFYKCRMILVFNIDDLIKQKLKGCTQNKSVKLKKCMPCPRVTD